MTDNNIHSIVLRRSGELLYEGEALLKQFSINSPVDWQKRPDCVSWMLSAVNLLEVALPEGSRYLREAQRLLPRVEETISPERLANLVGLFKSATTELRNGLINTLELKFIGLAFEDFLQYAAAYNQEGKKMEAAILASAVLEDTVKRLCAKHDISTADTTLEPQINALKARQVISKVKAERLRAYAALRNQAFHAKWDAFDMRDLRQMIEGLEEVIETHFA